MTLFSCTARRHKCVIVWMCCLFVLLLVIVVVNKMYLQLEKCLILDLLFISTIKGIACLTFIAVIYDCSALKVSVSFSFSLSTQFTSLHKFSIHNNFSMLNYERKTNERIISTSFSVKNVFIEFMD